MKRFLALVAAALLAGCSTPSAPPPLTGNVQVDAIAWQNFTVADLDNAESLALASGDVISQPCYPALKAIVESLPITKPPVPGTPAPTVGLATQFQQARGIINPLRAGIPTGLLLGCGPLASQLKMDVTTLIAKIASGAAIGIASGGIAVTPLLVQ